MSRGEAFVGLALQFWRHVLTTPWRETRGLTEIMRDFAGEGIAVVTEDERNAAPYVTRCTGCGRCDFLVPDGEPPSLVLLRVSRQSGDAQAAWPRLSKLQSYAPAIAAVCPERVDVPRVIARVRRLVDEAGKEQMKGKTA